MDEESVNGAKFDNLLKKRKNKLQDKANFQTNDQEITAGNMIHNKILKEPHLEKCHKNNIEVLSQFVNLAK